MPFSPISAIANLYFSRFASHQRIEIVPPTPAVAVPPTPAVAVPLSPAVAVPLSPAVAVPR